VPSIKQQRVQLVMRLAPEDHRRVTEMAQEQGRSLGELISVLYRENELLKARQAAIENGVTTDGR
jgi:predicted HicB family RNase H-like nuclease